MKAAAVPVAVAIVVAADADPVGCALRVYGSGVRGQPWRWSSSKAEREFRAMERQIKTWGRVKAPREES